jgi:hypothetical protein
MLDILDVRQLSGSSNIKPNYPLEIPRLVGASLLANYCKHLRQQAGSYNGFPI